MIFTHKPVSLIHPELSNITPKQITKPDGSRTYEINGVSMPSVTTVLSVRSKKSIQEWRKKVGEDEANKISSAASFRGTQVHQMCENYLNNSDSPYTEHMKSPMPQSKLMFDGMKSELNRINNVRLLEKKMWSNKIELAGTVDCVGEYDGVLSIIDFKTSSKPKKREWISNYFAQGTAYSIMYNEMYGEVPRQVVIIITVANGEQQTFISKPQDYYDYLIESKEMYYNA